MLMQFESDSILINLFFQNRPNADERRCVRTVSSWDKVYCVSFYWGKSTFVSKASPILGRRIGQASSGLIREFPDPLILKQSRIKQRKKNNQLTPRWTKQQHQQWVESRELQVRHYWGYQQYSACGKPEDVVEAMAAFAVLDLPPFTATSEVKKAFRNLALRYHPDQGGNENTFRFLKESYQKALLYADDYLLVKPLGVF